MKKDKKKKKEKHKYVFPNIMAKAMSKIDFRAQLEASMLSQFLLLVGLTIMVFYMAIFNQGSVFYKCVLIFNLVCGWVLISSYLVTTYQQYTNYMVAMGIDPEEEKRIVKQKGNIFKRIAIARKNKREKKNLAPKLVEDALENLKKIESKDVNTEFKKEVKPNGRRN